MILKGRNGKEGSPFPAPGKEVHMDILKDRVEKEDRHFSSICGVSFHSYQNFYNSHLSLKGGMGKMGKEVRMEEARLDSGRNERHRSGVHRKGKPFSARYGSHGNKNKPFKSFPVISGGRR